MAEWLKHPTHNWEVAGSIPAGCTINSYCALLAITFSFMMEKLDGKNSTKPFGFGTAFFFAFQGLKDTNNSSD